MTQGCRTHVPPAPPPPRRATAHRKRGSPDAAYRIAARSVACRDRDRVRDASPRLRRRVHYHRLLCTKRRFTKTR